jgi:AraC-like DNA-binding protein
MVVKPRVFRSLCRARALLCKPAQEEPQRPPSIEEIAHQIGLSSSHFTRLCESVFGATPHQLRIDARLDQAKDLLAAGRLSVTEVCMEVGFSSLGSFSLLFGRRVGTPPSRYARRPMVQVPDSFPAALPLPRQPGCLSLMAHLPAGALSQFSRSTPAGPTSRLASGGKQ